jgi:LacI family transcriptional regulator, galactose operon repressor
MSSHHPHLGRPARPTMKDVASLAGVAIKTVSRVMNGEPTVAPELAARVREAAVKLGYRPNLTASSLRRGDRRTATFLDREPRFLQADAVVSDNRGGAVSAVDHVRSFGHRRIAYLGDSQAIVTAGQRFDGYQHALERAGLAADPLHVRHDLRTVDDAARATAEIPRLPVPPTALFTSQNLVTIGALKAVREAGLQDTGAMVGFDDFQVAELLVPGITVVTQDIAQLGRLATKLLFDRLDGKDIPLGTHVVATGLTVRGSGEIKPAAEIRPIAEAGRE